VGRLPFPSNEKPINKDYGVKVGWWMGWGKDREIKKDAHDSHNAGIRM
jgi:hypothetical protein